MENEETSTEVTTVERVDKMDENTKNFYLLVLGELLKSAKFNAFLEKFFTIQQGIDSTNKIIDIRVIEKPITFSQEFTLEQMVNLRKVLDKACGFNAASVFKEAVEALGGHASNIPSIEVVSSFKDVDLDA